MCTILDEHGALASFHNKACLDDEGRFWIWVKFELNPRNLNPKFPNQIGQHWQQTNN
jgi:hypothetical protein